MQFDQLKAFVQRHGPVLPLQKQPLTVEGISGEGMLAVGSFRGPKRTYIGVLCAHTRVAGRPGAEVWAVLSGERTLASFAIHEGQLLELTRRGGAAGGATPGGNVRPERPCTTEGAGRGHGSRLSRRYRSELAMSRTKLRLFALPSGGARAEVRMRGLVLAERLQVALALLWVLLTGHLRLEIPHASTSVRGELVPNDQDG